MTLGELKGYAMTQDYLVEVPLNDGENRIVVEVDPRDLPQDLTLATRERGKIVTKAPKTLESALEDIQPGLEAVVNRIRAIANVPDEATVEFGLKLGGQTGIVVARGTAEVNFVVKLTWKK
jgi:hypothetical protein